MYVVPIKKVGYDPFIDYLKGISILFVVLLHCLPLQNYLLCSLWASQAVPIFLLIQVFHVVRGGNKNKRINYKKLFNRILKPYLLTLMIQFVLSVLVYGERDIILLIKRIIGAGGIGPGSYYVWVYLQFYFLLPFMVHLMHRMSDRVLFWLFTSLCVALEILCSSIQMSEPLYRLLAIRYLYLIYLGYLWVKKGIILNNLTLSLSGVSIVFILLFTYTSINWEPLFYDSGWKIYHWVSYFYVAYLFVVILSFIYTHIGKKIKDLLCMMGKYSYEIFLMQMFLFSFLPSAKWMDFIGNIYITSFLRVLLSVILSVFPILVYKHYKEQCKRSNAKA